MPSKKKKYNSRFPPARIKKIMQTDDEIGKVAAAVPVLISKCLEMFLVSILQHTGEVTKTKHAKTMSTSHLKECINNVGMFDFLKDVVANVADMQNEDEPGTSNARSEETKKTARKRTAAHPKTPKKRAKMGTATQNPSKDETGSSDDEESGGETSQDSSNGLLSSSLSSTGHTSPKNKTKQSVESHRSTSDSASFHIPLSSILSSEADENAKRSSKETSQEVKKKLLKKIDSSAEAKQKLSGKDSADGQVALDMSIKTSAQQTSRCPVIVTNSAVVAQNKLSASGPTAKVSNTASKPESNGSHLAPTVQSPAIPSPLNMTHLYRPIPGVPMPPGSTKPGEQTMPEGGMLSFLYSPFTGEAQSQSVLTPRTVGEPAGHQAAKDINLYKPGTLTPGFQYPYNPVSARRDSSPLALSQFPSVSQAQGLGPKQPDDDEDYDA